MLYNIKNAKIIHNRENIFMKHIFTLFLAFLLPTLPAFGLSLSDKSPVFKFCNGGGQIKCNKITGKDGSITYRGILACTAGKKSGISEQELDEALENYCNNISGPSDIDKTSEPVVKNKVLSINGGAVVSDGKDNITLRVTVKSPNTCKIKGSSLHTANSDLVHTIECPSTATSLTLQYSIDDQKQAFAYNIENPTQTINLNKARSGYNLPEKIQITKKQATSKPKTTTAAPADEDFDFVAAQKSDRAAYETDYDAPTPTPAQKPQKKETKPAPRDTYDELQTVGEIHAADAAADAERAKPKQTKKEPDFDFAAQSANDMNASAARSGLQATPAPEPATPEKSERQKNIEDNMKKDLTVQPKTEKKKLAQTKAEQERLERTALTKFCKDEGYVYKKHGTETASLGYVKNLCDNNNKVEFICYSFKGNSIPANEIIKHFANYCYTNTTNSCESKKESRPSDHYNKKDAQRAEKQEQNKIGKRCEIENAKSAKYTQQPSGAIVCEPDECICGYEIVVKSSNNYTCQKWNSTPSCLSQDLDKNATKGHYECKNNKKVCVIDDCDYKTHYLDSAKNKCVAKSTVKCADDEDVDNAGKCQKNVKVDFNKPGDMTGHEWTEADGERMKCDQDKDKKHTKFENNKCVCESNDYEMQSDGYCTLKRAKCLKQKNTKYENGRCVCTSDDFEMHKDNNCYHTAEALDREASEMEDAENAANDAKSSAEVIQLLCTDSGGTWKNDKCTCPKGYELNDTNECEITNEAQKLAEKEKACTETDGNWNKTSKICKCKTGFTTSHEGKCVSTYDEEKANSCAETGGKWTKKNTCNCKTGWKLDENGICQPNEKTVNKQRHKELCTSPNTWNDTLNKCTCNDKKQFFDDELGCTAASQAFTNAETELNTLKGQLDTKLTELASANESEEQ